MLNTFLTILLHKPQAFGDGNGWLGHLIFERGEGFIYFKEMGINYSSVWIGDVA